jgi:hypothetical protein
MDWHLAVSLAVLPLALYTQLRTRGVNVPALASAPLLYAVLTAHLAGLAASRQVPVWPPAALLGCGAALGWAQGRGTTVFYDAASGRYRQRGGLRPLAFWGAALLLRQLAARLAGAGLDAADAHLATALDVDAVLAGLLGGRAAALLLRHPDLWRAGLAQLRGEPATPPRPAGLRGPAAEPGAGPPRSEGLCPSGFPVSGSSDRGAAGAP